MKGYIPIKEIPTSCLECEYCRDYLCHAVGEYFPKYTAQKTGKPVWCPITESDYGESNHAKP